MPLFTQYYGLGIKLANEQYSASLDRARFLTIDNQLAFLCDFIGDGRIDGWHLAAHGPNGVRVGSGIGLIDRYATRTFGPTDLTLAGDGTWFLWMRRKPNVIGGFGEFSQQVWFTYNDTTPPADPTGLAVTATTRDSISLDWNPNADTDIATYRVYRSVDNTVSGWAAVTSPVAEVTLSAYTDAGLDDETQYYYRVRAVDSTGNVSTGFAAVSAMTLQDTRTPAPARSIKAYSGNGVIQVTWLGSPDAFVTGYTVTLQRLTASGGDDGAAVVANVGVSVHQQLFSSLTNGVSYRLTVQAKQKNGFLSEGISAVSAPTFNSGPAEVTAVTLTDTFDNGAVTLHVGWTPDGTATAPSRYAITVTENGSTAQTFTVLAGTAKAISVLNGKPLKEYTDYSVRVQGLDAAGVANVGVVQSIRTQKYTDPDPVSDLTLSVYNSASLLVGWANPSTDFAYVKLTLSRTDLDTLATTLLIDGRNVAKAQSFPYESYHLELASRYRATVVTVDVAGNQSDPVETTLEVESEIPAPPEPEVITADPGMGYMTVRWSAADIGNVASYKVYRADGNSGLMPEDFVLLDTVDADTLEIIDYDVETGQNYAYVVSTVDSWGTESHGPGDGTPTMNIAMASTRNQSFLSRPENVLGSLTGANYTLTWDAADDFFDGWQVYRADGDLTFDLLAAVPRDQTTYTDANINIVGGRRYTYIVRKYRDEAEVAVTATSAPPDDSIALGKVSVDAGEVTPDETAVVEIKNIEDPVIEEAQRRIREHHHAYISDTDDRRIQLGNVITIGGWTTDDNYVFTTTEDIGSSDLSSVPYTVQVNGVQTELLFELDRTLGQITFEQELAAGEVVTLVFENVEEVQGTLPEEKIAYITANNINKDRFDARLLPALNHDGRIGEKLKPVTAPFKTSDYLVYTRDGKPPFDDPLFNRGTVTARTFYDITETPDGLLAATSHGLCISEDFGHEWTRVQDTSLPATRVIRLTSGYAAAVGNTVLFSTNLLTDWHAYDGLAGVHLVRDLVKGNNGKVYATTDVGVFCFDPALAEPYWVQCAQPDYSSSNFYAAMYDTGLSAVVVSGDGGLFYTTDDGATWSLWSAFTQTRPAFTMFRSDDAIFALTEDRLFRKLDADAKFSQVAYFTSRVRKAALFNGRLYVSSEEGIYMSSGDVYSQTTVPFDLTLPQLAEGDNRYVMTTLNVISGRLLLGTEKEVYASATHGSASLQYRQTGTTAPSVYVNGELRTLGVYNTAASATFDVRLNPDDVVEYTNQYLTYDAPNGGWADVSYESPLTVYYNNSKLNEAADSRMPASVNAAAVVVPELTNRNSDFAKASAFLQDIEASKIRVADEATADRVAQLFTAITALEAVVDPSVVIPKPQVVISLYTSGVNVGSADAATGRFTFTTNVTIGGEVVGIDGDPFRFTKYSDIRADIRGVTLLDEGELTHEEIDDVIERRLSGIDAKFARVQQVNLVKSGLFIEKTWPGERVSTSPPKQMQLFVGCGLTWYDKFNSTVDYALRVRKNPTDVSITYPACVLHVPARDEVWVGGLGGIVAVNKNTVATDATITSVYAAPDRFCRHLLLDEDTAYAVVGDVVYTIGLTDLAVTPDNGIGLPSGITSLAVAHNNLIAGASDGVYIKRITGVWERVVDGQDMEVTFLGDLLMAYDIKNRFYSSPSGEAWTDKGDPTPLIPDDPTTPEDEAAGNIQPDLKVSKAIRHRAVFLAASDGLYEDNMTFYSRGIKLKKANVTGDADEQISVNDIASNGEVLLVGLSDGRYYTYEVGSDTGGFFEHDASGVLDTIHRVAVIDDGLWLFGFDKVFVVSQNAVLKLATGKRISWVT